MASLNLTFNPLSENHLFQVPKVAIVNRFGCTFKTVYSSHPWDPQKVAVVYRWLLCRGFSIKMVSKLAWRDFFWLLLRGSLFSEVAVNTGLTVVQIKLFSSKGDRNFYVGKPIVTDAKFFDAVHQKFKDFVGPFVAATAGAFVVDFAVESKQGT
jgi:hypothetical protein